MDLYVILVEDGETHFVGRQCFKTYKGAKEYILREESYKEIEDFGIFEGKHTTARIKKVVLED